MASPPRIILHVGAPKTGSTYLQRRLRGASEICRRHGLFVPVWPPVARMAGNAKILAMALDGQSSPIFQRSFPAVDVRSLDPEWVRDRLLEDWRPPEETLLLSAENLRPHHPPLLRELLPAEAHYTVLLFVRRQDQWVESYYNQFVKAHETHEAIGAFMQRLCAATPRRLCCPDWYAHYEAWHAAFGTCTVVIYDEVKANLCGAFFAAAGLDPIPALPEIERVQVSLGLYPLAYLLQVAPTASPAEFARRRTASIDAARQHGSAGSYSLLSPRDRAWLKKRFEPTNDRLLAALGRRNASGVLDIPTEAPDFCDLRQLYASPAYARYRALADTLYAQKQACA